MFVICFIIQWMKRSKVGLFVFPPKKTLIWRSHCSIDQSCCSITSKRSIDWFLESSSGMNFFQPSVRAFVSVRQTNQIALFPFVYCFCFFRAFSFQGHTKIAQNLLKKVTINQIQRGSEFEGDLYLGAYKHYRISFFVCRYSQTPLIRTLMGP